jgi:hypothetical protein
MWMCEFPRLGRDSQQYETEVEGATNASLDDDDDDDVAMIDRMTTRETAANNGGGGGIDDRDDDFELDSDRLLFISME